MPADEKILISEGSDALTEKHSSRDDGNNVETQKDKTDEIETTQVTAKPDAVEESDDQKHHQDDRKTESLEPSITAKKDDDVDMHKDGDSPKTSSLTEALEQAMDNDETILFGSDPCDGIQSNGEDFYLWAVVFLLRCTVRLVFHVQWKMIGSLYVFLT